MTKPGGEGMFREEAQDAAFGDVAVALSLLSGEVIHEVTHTLNFLRLFLQEPASDADAEISRFAHAELERMQRMVRHLRTLKLRMPEPTDVSLSALVRQSIEHVQKSTALRRVSFEACILADTGVRTEEACLGAALRKLLRDALGRAPEGTSIVISAAASEPQPLQLEISDEGEALSEHEATPLGWQNAGRPMSSTFQRALAHRLLRHLGWSLSYERQAQRNVFRLAAPLPMSFAR